MPDQENSSDSIAEKLELARKELLDLGFRNKLINHRLLKSKGIQADDELSDQLYNILVEKGNKMYFDPVPEEEEEEEGREEEDLFDFSQPEEEEDKTVSERHTDNRIQTSHSSKRLQRRLLNTYYAANTHIQEKGVNVLYLALGMLYWYESDSSEKLRKSPLILIPVVINRSSAQSKFDVKYTGDEVGGNLSLQAKMKMDFGINFPLPKDEEIEIKKYFKEVENVIKNQNRWRVEPNDQCISFFSFSKFLMYNDLDPEKWSEDNRPDKHPIIKSLLGDGFSEPDSLVSKEDNIDEHLDPKDIFQVVNADSSQTQAIIDINQGRNLVVQGPPGTGKSQTITNIIAESMAIGKKVLFVSEKMAALEVVKRRMDEVGLGIACLEIHSHNTNKKAFLDELKSTLKLGKPNFEHDDFDANGLKLNRDKLNTYSEAVNTNMGKSYITPFQAYGKILSLNRKLEQIELPSFEKKKLLRLNRLEFRENLDLIQKLQAQVNRIGRPKDHFFWGSKLKVYLPSHKPVIEELIQKCIDNTNDLLKGHQNLKDDLSLPFSEKYIAHKNLLKLTELLLRIPDGKFNINYESRSWVNKKEDLIEVIRIGSKINKLKSKYASILVPEAWEEDVLAVKRVLTTTGKSWWRFISPEFYNAKKNLLGLSTGNLPKKIDDLIKITDSILEYKRIKPKLTENELLLKEVFRDHFRGEESDWHLLSELNSWILELKNLCKEIGIDEEVYIYLNNGIDKASLSPLLKESKNALEGYKKSHDIYFERIKIEQKDLYGESGYSEKTFSQQILLLRNQLEHVEKISEITSLNNSFKVFEEAEMDFVNEVATNWKPAGQYLDLLFELRWLEAYLADATEKNGALAGFSAEIHEEVVKKFRNLDEQLLIQNRGEIAYKHWENLPKHNAGGVLGVLKREFSKKRRHKPIRKLIEECGNVIQDIKPVFMMSPLSVSTYLPPDSIQFDLVIFDEASQVKPVDAFSPLLRGKQAVVVGDSKQLPPTSFFDTDLDLDDEEEQSDTGDMESILGLFEGQGVPSKMLRWHYRSEHESLIAVSNFEFYDNDLVLFPSPDVDRKELGIRYNHLPETYYERGRGKSYNRGEAKKVAEGVLKHAEKYPELTLGVAAFSQSQMKVILDELEIIRRKNSKFESFFNDHPEEPFFVKNLENVQGDERDIIFISIGYGKNEDGHLSMNFGPLNKDGGERRLNVLITRARKRCEIFTNLLPLDIDLTRSHAKGIVALKRYLKFANTGVLDIPEETGKEADSLFEEEVAHELRQRGYEIINQVGSAGFYVDLGVRTPTSNGEFVLGIECDGATYHSARSARDRDRTRQLVLERIGWNIHRVWSTDWFKNREKEVSKLLESIKFHSKNGSTSNDKATKSSYSNYERIKVDHIEKEAFNSKYLEASIINYNSVKKDYQAKFSRDDLVEAIIYKIVDVESPIYKEIVYKKVADELGYGRVGSNIRYNLDVTVVNMNKNKIVILKNNFLYKVDSEVTVRNRESLSNDLKKIDMIAPEEIQKAIIETIKLTYGGDFESIIKEVGNNLGFNRVTENIFDSIKIEVDACIKEEEIILNDGKLNLP